MHTCADLRAWSLAELTQAFGSFGASLHRLSRGVDERAVRPDRARKSLSVETTYVTDLPDLTACQAALPALIAEFRTRFTRAREARAVHKAVVKIKFSDFTQTTAECVVQAPDDGVWHALLDSAYARKLRPVRLLGVGVRFVDEEPLEPLATQFVLFETPQ